MTSRVPVKRLNAVQVAADTIVVVAYGIGILRVGSRRFFVFSKLQRAFTFERDTRVVELAYAGEKMSVVMKPPLRTRVDVAGTDVPSALARIDVPHIEFPHRVDLWENA